MKLSRNGCRLIEAKISQDNKVFFEITKIKEVTISHVFPIKTLSLVICIVIYIFMFFLSCLLGKKRSKNFSCGLKFFCASAAISHLQPGEFKLERKGKSLRMKRSGEDQCWRFLKWENIIKNTMTLGIKFVLGSL